MLRVRERFEPLLERVAAERHAHSLSEMQPSRVGAAYASQPDLFGRIRDVQLALAGASGREEKRIRALLEGLVHARASCAAAAELDQLLTWYAQPRFQLDDGRVALRRVRALLAAAHEPEERAALLEAWHAAADEQTPLLEGYLARYRESVVELGYGAYVESCEILSGIDLRGLGRDAQRFLGENRDEYLELLDWHLEHLADTSREEATEADLMRLQRAPGGHRHFGSSLVWGLQTLLAETQLDVLAGGRIRVERHRTLPGSVVAQCHALRIPGEVVCDVAPVAGISAHAAFLRTMGQALHQAYTDPDLPLESRWLGDESVPLAMGDLFAGLLSNRVLLARFYRLPQADLHDYLRLHRLLHLLRVRRYAGLFLFQLQLLERPDSREARESFAEHLTAATGVRHPPLGALLAAEPAFRVARRLRAEQLQAVLGTHLRERFDEDWFRNPRAGEALLALFRPGRSFSASELAVQLGAGGLAFGPLKDG
jgi:hypothetical protein